jgi:hypothetical protein
MENLFSWLKVDWEFSLAVPGVWSSLYYPALILIGFFNGVSLICLARILIHNASNNNKVIRLAIGLMGASMAYGVGTPLLAINSPVSVRNIIGSFGMALFMCCITSGKFRIDLSDKTPTGKRPPRLPERLNTTAAIGKA